MPIKIGLMFLILLGFAACGPSTPTAPAEPADTPTSPPPTETPTPDPPAPLVPPTRVPYPSPAPTSPPEASTIRRVLDSGMLRVGIKLNEPPFGTLDREGNIVGYDADIARTLAESWGVQLELVQVTGQTAAAYLMDHEVDLLIAAMPHRRDAEAYMDFSHSYFPDGQAVMVLAESDIETVGALEDRHVAVVAGSHGVEALEERGLDVQLEVFDILEDAVAALVAGEVNAVVDTRVHLQMAQREVTTTALHILEEMLHSAPLAMGLLRYDTHFHDALNRTLHAMERGGRLKEIHDAWFPGQTYPGIVTWEDNDPRSFADYPTDFTIPESTLARLRAGEPLRVAGLSLAPPDEGTQQREAFYLALVEALAARWDVPVDFLADSANDPAAWVADGRADLAVGVEPLWEGADAVAYSQAFLLHGNRLLVPADGGFRGFGDLRSKRVGVFGPEAAQDEEKAQEMATTARVRLASVSQYADAEAAVRALSQNKEDAIFGDSLALGPLIEANPDRFRFTERFYSQRGAAFALPNGDADFRALVNFTLQDLYLDGTYAQLYAEKLGWDKPLPVEVWPGSDDWLQVSPPTGGEESPPLDG